MENHKLTTEQISQIEKILISNGLIFEDLKLELTDHIASEIEVLMPEKELDFEIALKITFENWKGELQPKSGFFWVSPNVTAPKIVMKQWEKNARKIIFQSLTISFFIVFLLWVFKLNNQEQLIYNNFNSVKQFLCYTLFSTFIIAFLWIKTTRIKTSYSYMFSRYSILIPLSMFPIFLNDFRFKRFEFSDFGKVLVLFYSIAIIIFGFLTLQMAFKHFKFISSFSKAKL